MCGGGGSSRAPDPPKERPPQVLRNPLLDQRMNIQNRGIGALTFRQGDRLRFKGSTGSLRDNTQLNQLRVGSAQGSEGQFTQLDKGADWLRQETNRRKVASKAYQKAQAQQRYEERKRQREIRDANRR